MTSPAKLPSLASVLAETLAHRQHRGASASSLCPCYTLEVSAPTLRQTVSQILVLAVAFPTALYTLGVVGWIAGIPLTPVLPAVALVVCLGVMVATQRSEISAVLVAVLVFGGVVAGALDLAAGLVQAC